MVNFLSSVAIRLDERLRTRPFLYSLSAPQGLSAKDLLVMAAATAKALCRFHGQQLQRTVAERFDIIVYNRCLGQRIPLSMMSAVHCVGDLTWSQPISWRAAQRARRAFGRIPLQADCTTIYCGFRSELRNGEALDMFVLTDKQARVLEVAYISTVDEDGVTLVPGYQVSRQPSSKVRAALFSLQTSLGVKEPEERVSVFYSS